MTSFYSRKSIQHPSSTNLAFQLFQGLLMLRMLLMLRSYILKLGCWKAFPFILSCCSPLVRVQTVGLSWDVSIHVWIQRQSGLDCPFYNSRCGNLPRAPSNKGLAEAYTTKEPEKDSGSAGRRIFDYNKGD